MMIGTTPLSKVENTIVKDVMRTDRKNPFYAGDCNPNIELMKSVLVDTLANAYIRPLQANPPQLRCVLPCHRLYAGHVRLAGAYSIHYSR